MLPDRVSNPGPLTYESGALPIALRGPATTLGKTICLLYNYGRRNNNTNKLERLYVSSITMGGEIIIQIN